MITGIDSSPTRYRCGEQDDTCRNTLVSFKIGVGVASVIFLGCRYFDAGTYVTAVFDGEL